MTLASEIEQDFRDHVDHLTKQKMSTKVRFHRKRAGVVGSLMFLADLAEKNKLLPLYDRLIANVKLARNAVDEQFKLNWVHNMRDVRKMNNTFLCDISEGYNAAQEQYLSKYTGAIYPDKMPLGKCPASPNVSKAINKLVKKLAAVN